MQKKFFVIASFILIYIIFLQGCYYHKADQEYPSTGGCDTTTVRFSVEIKSILDANCKGCHEGPAPVTGIDLYNYETISALALDGKFTYGTLLSAVMHEGGAPEMPQGLPQLQDCDINKIAAWVHDEAPNN